MLPLSHERIIGTKPPWYFDAFVARCMLETEVLTDAKGKPDALIVHEHQHDFIFSDRKSIAWVESYWVEFSVLYSGLKKPIPLKACQILNGDILITIQYSLPNLL